MQGKLEFVMFSQCIIYNLGFMSLWQPAWDYYVSGQGKLAFIMFLCKASLSLLGFWARQALVYYVSGQGKLEFIRFLGKATLS